MGGQLCAVFCFGEKLARDGSEPDPQRDALLGPVHSRSEGTCYPFRSAASPIGASVLDSCSLYTAAEAGDGPCMAPPLSVLAWQLGKPGWAFSPPAVPPNLRRPTQDL